jgi:hypothetical protein
MSLPKPSFDMINSKIPMGIAFTNAAIANISSRAKLPAVAMHRIATPMMATPPEIPVTSGVMWVMSLTGAPHMVCVLFCAPILIS